MACWRAKYRSIAEPGAKVSKYLEGLKVVNSVLQLDVFSKAVQGPLGLVSGGGVGRVWGSAMGRW